MKSPKFTLRDLFAVVTVVALALAWFVDHRSLRAASQQLRREMEVLQVHREAEDVYAKEATRAMELFVEERARANKLQEELSRIREPSVPWPFGCGLPPPWTRHRL